MATDRDAEVSGTVGSKSDGPVIELQDLRKTFNDGEVVAVEDFNLTIDNNEFVVFLGPSGCGKTTTLRCVSGLEQPDSGNVLIHGEDETFTAPKDRDLAFVFQEIALYPHMTVRENMRFGLDMEGEMPPQEKEKIVREVAELLDIGDLLNRKPSALSGGQRQRVSLGRAMVMEPVAFLLDEPFSNLDANLRDTMRIEIKKLQRQVERAMIFVTHDQEEALTLGDKIVVMNAGRVQQVGAPSEIYNDPANQFVAEFIGSPSTNLIECDIRRETGRIIVSNDAFDLTLDAGVDADDDLSDGDTVTLGISPEHFRVNPAGDGLFEAEITVIENLGRDDAIYLSTEVGEVRVITDVGVIQESDERVTLDIVEDEIWIFDQSGNRLV